MKTAIVYASHHGTTEKVAQKISKAINSGEVKIFNLKEVKLPVVSEFDCVIIGGSIHAGSIQKSIKFFCDKNQSELLKKRLGLFLCCMEKDKAQEQFDNAYPGVLRNQAKSCKILGGEFIFSRMNFIEKFMVRKISGINESISTIDEGLIAMFVSEMLN